MVNSDFQCLTLSLNEEKKTFFFTGIELILLKTMNALAIVSEGFSSCLETELIHNEGFRIFYKRCLIDFLKVSERKLMIDIGL